MNKKWISWLLAVLLAVTLAVPAAAIQAESLSGSCGENMTWSLEGYTLTISGSGEMGADHPWQSHKDHVEHIVFSDGITAISADAFNGFDRVKTVEFGQDLQTIGDKAFYGCKRLRYIHLPSTFRSFGAQAFRDCEQLEYVYCDGGMPRFNDSCLWTGGYVSVFYPTNNPWPAGSVSQLMQNFGGRMGIFMGNFEDSEVIAQLQQETEPAATEPLRTAQETQEILATVATVPETVPPTTAATQPVVPTTYPAPTDTDVPQTIHVTVPATVAFTEAASAPTNPWAADEATQPEQEPEKPDGSWIPLMMLVGMVTLLLAGIMIVRGTRRRG